MQTKNKIPTVRIDVLDELGFSPEETALLRIKVNLQSEIVKKAKHYSQMDLGEILGERQPRVSDLMRGKVSKFSLDKLVTYADRLNMVPEIQTAKTKPPRLEIVRRAHA